MAYHIYNGIISTGVSIGTGNQMYIYNGGIASNTYINSNGIMSVFCGGIASNTAIHDGGRMVIDSGALAKTTSVCEDGRMTIYNGGVANNTNLTGDLWVEGVANNTHFDWRGCMYISNGGVANYTVCAGSNTYSARMYVKEGGIANYTAVDYRGYMYISNGGVANSTTVDSSGTVFVSKNGLANYTIIRNSAYMYIHNGGTASCNNVSSGGYMYISSGGKVTGELNIASGGVVSAYAGAIVDFDLRNRTAESMALVKDLSLISGTPTYTITVSAQQASGVYKLAQGASAFSGSVTVCADGTVLGSLGVNKTLEVDNTEYKLDLSDELLQFTVIRYTPIINDKGYSYGGNCNGTIINENIEMLVDDGSYKRFYGGNYVEKSKSFVDIAGSIDLTVNGGTFSSVVAGGDHVVDGIVERTGSITVVINGGTFANNVAGGMCLDIAADNFGQVNAIANDINLTIAGGTFAKRIFGGNISAKVAQSGHADVKGNINLTIDATASDITFSENIAAGSSGYSWVHGNVTVTLKKSASYTLDMQGLLSGGGEGAVYVSGADGSRTATSYVAGERTLVLDSYVGEFAGTLFMFENLEVKNNTAIEFTNEKINLRDITSWDIEYGSSLEGIARNDFAGDNIDIDLTGWDSAEAWEIMSGSDNAFDSIADAASVTLGGQTATWNGYAWASSDYELKLSEDEKSLLVTLANA